MKLLFNQEHTLDVVNILLYIETIWEENFGKKIPSSGNKFQVDANKIQSIVTGLYMDFPYSSGIQDASLFKKVSSFMCYFSSGRPIQTSFPIGINQFWDKLARIPNHENAFFATMIGIHTIENSVIHGSERTCTISNPIALSEHSIVDIVEAVSEATPATHFKLLTVLLEQLAYKTNIHCQYPNIF
jgi:hypothetical protein